MKREFLGMLVFLCLVFVLVAGCTTPTTTPNATTPATPTATPAVPALPNLIGNWTGTSRGYVEVSGYQVADEVIRMTVVNQTGRLFKGQLSFPVNGTMTTKEFAAILGDDGKTIEDVEYPTGFSDGVVISADEIELIFRDQANPSTITIDSLKRSTAADQNATHAVQPMTNLVGKWNGTSTGYGMETSDYMAGLTVVSINVTEQNDRLFKGQVSYMVNRTAITKEFAGVFDCDGKTFRTVEFPDGFSDGVILSSDEFELIFRDNANPSRVDIDLLRRSNATTPSVTSPVLTTPDIIGSWSGNSTGYRENVSGYEVIQGTMTMQVTEQKGRLFKGQVAYVVNGTSVTKEFAGVFGRDAKSIATVEYPDGFSNGVVVSADQIQLVFRNTDNPSEIALDMFTRSK